MNAKTTKTAFYGWRVVWAAFVLAIFGWGVGSYGPSIFLHNVVERTGWPLALVSAGVTLHFLVGAVVVANLPALYHRFGLPTVTQAGALALALGVGGWALATAPWQFFLATLLSGAGWVTMGAAALNAIVAPWFQQKRPAALSLAYNGASIGGVILSPLWVALIAQLGFATAALLVGAVMLLVVCCLARFAFAKSPQDLGQHPDGLPPPVPSSVPPAAPSTSSTSGSARALPGSALWRDRAFATLALGMALGLFAQIGIIAHLFSVLVPSLGAQTAGLALGLATAAAIAGRSLVGWLMPPKADRRRVAAVSYGVQFVGSLLFLAAGNSVALLFLAILLFGSGIGNATSLPPLIAQAEFAARDLQRVVSQIVAMGQATYAFAPAAFGLLRDDLPPRLDLAAGDTTLFFGAAATVQICALACFLFGRGATASRAGHRPPSASRA